MAALVRALEKKEGLAIVALALVTLAPSRGTVRYCAVAASASAPVPAPALASASPRLLRWIWSRSWRAIRPSRLTMANYHNWHR